MSVCVHVLSAMSSHQFKSNSFQFKPNSFPSSLFINTSSHSEELGSHYPQELCSLSQYKHSPQWSSSFHAHHLCTSHPLCSVSLDTAHTTVPTSLWHPFPTLPYILSSATMRTAIATHFNKPLPLTTASWDTIISFQEGKERKVGKEGKFITYACLLRDAFGEPHMPFTTLASVLNAQIWHLHPLTSLYSLNITYPSLKLRLSWKQKSLNNVQLIQLGMQL